MQSGAKSLGKPRQAKNERRPVRGKVSGSHRMMNDENKHSGSGTNETSHSQPEHLQSNEQESSEPSMEETPFQDGLLKDVVDKTKSPNELRRDSLLSAIGNFNAQAHKKKVKARRRPR